MLMRKSTMRRDQCQLYIGENYGPEIDNRSPVPRRGRRGNDILGPQNPDRMRQEPDTVCPPDTDHGKMPNMKWSVTVWEFSL